MSSNTTHTPLWHLRPSPTSGYGLFATVDIPADTPILSEPPLLVVPCEGDLSGHTEDQIHTAVTALPPPARTTYRSLHGADPSLSLIEQDCQIFRFNRFSEEIAAGQLRSVVYDSVSRLNHSCKPNAALCGNQLISTRQIPTGDEITIDYQLNETILHRERAIQLWEGWMFECACWACTNAFVDDQQRRLITQLEELVLGDEMCDVTLDEQIEAVQRYLRLMRDEGAVGEKMVRAYVKLLKLYLAKEHKGKIEMFQEAKRLAEVWGVDSPEREMLDMWREYVRSKVRRKPRVD